MQGLHTALKNSKREVSRLREKLERVTERSGITLDLAVHDDLSETMKNQSSSVAARYPPNTFARLFWDQQLEAASRRGPKGMKWHPLMIKWCIYLRHQSGRAYELLRDSGCIALPSQRTLRDYSHYVAATSGFSDATDQQLMEAAGVSTAEEWQKCVVLILDEMHVREDLVYEKHTGALIGFTDFGDINNHLLRLERSLDEKSANEPLAKAMMVFMVRGLFTRLQFAYAQFPVIKLTGELLFAPFWEAVRRCERCGLKVLAATADGASVNRRLIKLHGASGDVVHKVTNPYAPEGRELFFISDPPHLVKTIRNCWASKARNLWVCYDVQSVFVI
jgi:hypothetical protein